MTSSALDCQQHLSWMWSCVDTRLSVVSFARSLSQDVAAGGTGPSSPAKTLELGRGRTGWGWGGRCSPLTPGPPGPEGHTPPPPAWGLAPWPAPSLLPPAVRLEQVTCLSLLLLAWKMGLQTRTLEVCKSGCGARSHTGGRDHSLSGLAQPLGGSQPPSLQPQPGNR